MLNVTLPSEPATANVRCADDVFRLSGIRRGLFVIATDDAGLALELASAEPIIAFVVASPEKVAGIRKEIVASGLHGRVTVSTYANGRLPLIDNLAAVVVADLDALPQVKREEYVRVVRPLGKLLVKQGGRHHPRGKQETGTYGPGTIKAQ